MSVSQIRTRALADRTTTLGVFGSRAWVRGLANDYDLDEKSGSLEVRPQGLRLRSPIVLLAMGLSQEL